ncbi:MULTISPECIES: hypothetical protein [Sporosarcina]|uniref:hypothetical protein n=1 Tax=Sporosarcina TaxID=1569 RepID=UPI00129B4E12|nr:MULTISPECIES: hypothetical protein [Sporosarcina]GKV67372.1 hypothetical protein NCCP2331_35250 [Sporosarcina sp. NCCP-2331]GLB57728.1 hypothetical protein NCCP2378_35180 [Sporosarcina sp. NCCP-2378]
MLIYFTLVAVFVFIIVISTVIGYLFHEFSGKLVTSGRIRCIAGMVVSVLVSIIMTKLLLFGIWYYYAAAAVVTAVLYIVLLKYSQSRH